MFVIFLVALFTWATWRLLKTNAIRTWLKQTCNQKDVVGIAKEYGLDFTADKISQLSEEELECVSAGTFLYTQMYSTWLHKIAQSMLEQIGRLKAPSKKSWSLLLSPCMTWACLSLVIPKSSQISLQYLARLIAILINPRLC